MLGGGTGAAVMNKGLGVYDKVSASTLGVPSKKKQYICGHCPNRREGGQPHVKKFK